MQPQQIQQVLLQNICDEISKLNEDPDARCANLDIIVLSSIGICISFPKLLAEYNTKYKVFPLNCRLF
jgi:hypothetical protein